MRVEHEETQVQNARERHGESGRQQVCELNALAPRIRQPSGVQLQFLLVLLLVLLVGGVACGRGPDAQSAAAEHLPVAQAEAE